MLLTALLPAARARAQISPGPLAAVHQDLEGAGNCTRCHALRRGSLSQLCASCHREVGWLVERGRGLHARVVATEKRECASCHPDHAGRDFALVSWPGGSAERFDHRQAGWELELSHRDVKCKDCHTATFRTGPAAALSRRRGSAGWVGLETSCASCHRDDDAHNSALGPRCETCHDAGEWTRAVRFDHARTAYPLTGEHQQVSCDGCHRSARLTLRRDANSEPIPLYKPVPFRECSTCHDDPHKGRLSPRCGECHTTRGFEIVDRTGFNHALTRYPLRGQHARVPCAGCHGTNLAARTPAFSTCAGCHADPHRGEAALRGIAADCGACHRVEGFAPSTYTVSQHAEAAYRLEGKHATVACASCHRAARAGGSTRPIARLRLPFGRCADCHADAHGGQLAGSGASERCESCHALKGWSPSTFSAAQHAGLALALEQRHAEVACGACHARARPGLPPHPPTLSLGAASIALRIPAACGSCHVDAHDGRYATASRPSGRCEECHTARQWRPSTVDMKLHAAFSFPLEGAHRAVPCGGCHTDLRGERRPASTLLQMANDVSRLPFTPRASAACASCHEGPHGAQFAQRKEGGACEPCHTLESFVPAARFDHERDAAFSLKGAHVRVPCARCHTAAGAPGTARVRYRPLSTKCESCHSGSDGGLRP